jgi:hypothetical protein
MDIGESVEGAAVEIWETLSTSFDKYGIISLR